MNDLKSSIGRIAAKPLVIIGGGGHGRVVLDAALLTGRAIAGFCDTATPVGDPINGAPVVAEFAWLLTLDEYTFIVAIGDQKARRVISLEVIAQGGTLETIVYPNEVPLRQPR